MPAQQGWLHADVANQGMRQELRGTSESGNGEPEASMCAGSASKMCQSCCTF